MESWRDSEKQKKYSRSAVQCTGAGTSLKLESWKERGGEKDSGWRFIEILYRGKARKLRLLRLNGCECLPR